VFQDQESFDLRNVEDHQTRNHETRQTLGQSLSNLSPSFKMADYISPNHHITMSYMNTSHVLSENQADEQRPIIHQHHNQLRKPDPERVFGPLECRNRHVGYVVYKACLPNLQCRNPVARNFKGPRRSLSAVLALISFRTGKVRPSNFLCLSSISIHPNRRFLTAYTSLVILAFPYQWSRRRSL